MSDEFYSGLKLAVLTYLALLFADVTIGLPNGMTMFPTPPTPPGADVGLTADPKAPIGDPEGLEALWVLLAYFAGGFLLGAVLKLIFYYLRGR